MSASLVVSGVLGAPVSIDATTVAAHNQAISDKAAVLHDLVEATSDSALIAAKDALCSALRDARTELHMPTATPVSGGTGKTL